MQLGNWKLDFNSPAVLVYSFISMGVYVWGLIFPNFIPYYFTLYPEFEVFSVISWFRMFSYIFGHMGIDHVLGNLAFILLLGPVLEEKYGSNGLWKMIFLTAVITAVFNLFFIKSAILGASGIVFMFIILISFGSVKRKSIPLTFVLVAFLFLGKEIIDGFKDDQISQFGHIFGGICGSFFGFKSKK